MNFEKVWNLKLSHLKLGRLIHFVILISIITPTKVSDLLYNNEYSYYHHATANPLTSQHLLRMPLLQSWRVAPSTNLFSLSTLNFPTPSFSISRWECFSLDLPSIFTTFPVQLSSLLTVFNYYFLFSAPI